MSARSSFETLERRRLFSGQPLANVSDAWVAEGNDGATTAAVVVSLYQARPRQSASVNWSTQNGTAVAGADYRAAGGKLTFAPGETSKTIPVEIIGDRVAGAGGYFLVNLQAAKGARVADGQGVVNIYDDEPRVYVGDVNAPEGSSGTTPFTFTVSLSTAYDRPVTVNYATADGTATDGSDYSAAAGSVTFAPGETSQTVTVPINGDRLVEQTESFSINLSNPSGHAEVVRGVGFGTILDDEPRISISDAANYWGDTSPFTFTVSLSAASDEVVTVNFATSDGTALAGQDYAATSGTLTFAAGQTTQTFQVALLNPDLGDRSFYVILSDPTNAPVVTGQGLAYWYYDSGSCGCGYWDYYYDYYGGFY